MSTDTGWFPALADDSAGGPDSGRVASLDRPIGIFDSGVGGLTVTRAIMDQLPHENITYIGDTARTPYGPRPIAEVRTFALQVMDHLVARGVKMLVIACNTASAACLRDARERYDVPVVEVIIPAARRAAKATRDGKVGVIGTTATITSQAYQDVLSVVPGVSVVARETPQFVPFVERGVTSGRQLLGLAEGYLAPLVAEGVDTLILGCTHYPLLTGVIGLVMGDDVTLVSSAEETAKDVYRTLSREDMLRSDERATEVPARRRLYATGDPDAFRRVGVRFFGPDVPRVRHADLSQMRPVAAR